MPDSHDIASQSLSFAKLVATPSPTGWSQAYNAANLFVCIALHTTEQNDDELLPSIGKETFQQLYQHFSELDEKNIAAIKDCVDEAIDIIPEQITASITLAFFNKSTVAVCVAGSGKISMKRSDKVGTLLQKNDDSKELITGATGYIHNRDTIILQSGGFTEHVSNEDLSQALELQLPTDIVEALSPKLHAHARGEQAAIIIVYNGVSAATEAFTTAEVAQEEIKDEIAEDADETTEEEALEEIEEDIDEMHEDHEGVIGEEPLHTDQEEREEEGTIGALYKADQDDTPHITEEDVTTSNKKEKDVPFIPKNLALTKKLRLPKMHLSHRSKLFLNIAIILFLLLGASIFFTMKQSNDEEQKALFAEAYASAEQYYEEGQGLEAINPSLSQDSYDKAEQVITNAQSKIDKGSAEYQQLQDLRAKVNDAQTGSGPTDELETIAAKEVTPDAGSILDLAKDKKGKAYGASDTTAYYVTDKAIVEVTGSESDIIDNDDAWKSPKAVIPYQANIYVLDQDSGIIKYAAGEDGYGQSDYFGGSGPDLSKAVGMAIDGSVWIVFTDGKVEQYTSGSNDNLSLSGFDTPLKNPKAIVTSLELGSVYVLDAGNNRIVQFSKSGNFEAEYSSPQLGNATIFTISSDQQTAQFLAGGKVFEIPLRQ